MSKHQFTNLMFCFSLGASTCNQGLAVQICGPVSDIVLSNNMWMYMYIYLYLISVVRFVRLVFAQAVHGELYAITETEHLMEIAPLHFEVTRHWLVSQPTAPEALGKESTSRNQPERVRQRSLNVNPMPGHNGLKVGTFEFRQIKKSWSPRKSRNLDQETSDCQFEIVVIPRLAWKANKFCLKIRKEK